MKKIICALIFCLLFPIFVSGGTFEENVHQSQKKAMEWFVRQYISTLFNVKFEAEGTEGKFVQNEMIARMTTPSVYNRNLVSFKYDYDMWRGGGSLQIYIDTLKTLNDDNFDWDALVMLKKTAQNSTQIVPVQIQLQMKCSPLGSEFREDNPFGCVVSRFDWQEREDILVPDSVKNKFDLKENWGSLKPKDCGANAFYSLPVLVCAFCSDSDPIPSTSDECDRCPNRKMRGKYCVLKDEKPAKVDIKTSNEGVSAFPQKREVKISERVVLNGKAASNMRICGSVAPSESCLMYILNNKHYDKIAEDFFEEVAQKSQRPMKVIRESNLNYAKSLIKSGYFAEIIVPALK